MKRRFYFLVLVGMLLTGATPLLASHHKSIQTSPEELKWMANPEKPEVSMAVVWGDMKKGAHGAFHKFKAGTVVDNHSHSSTLKGVVVAGTMVMGPEDAPKTLPTGSFFMDAKGENHITKCEGTTDCIIYVESSGKFDIKYPKKSKK